MSSAFALRLPCCRRFHEAKEAGISEVEVWGTGRPRREFLRVDDLADSLRFC